MLTLLSKYRRNNNQSDADFDMAVLKCKENTKTIFAGRRDIEEENKKIYSLFADQCKTFLIYKLKVTNGCNKFHNPQDGVNILKIIKSVICGIEAHLKGTWYIMKEYKCLYTLLQCRNTPNNDYMKSFDAYIKFIEF